MEQRLRAQFKRLARYSKGCSRSILLLAFVVVVSGGGLTQAQTSSSGGYMVSASPTTVAPGGTVTVPWQAPSNHSSRDWIGLFRVGTVSSGATVLGWKYVPSGTSGMMTFAVPNITAQYEVRYLLNDKFVQAAVSGPVTVTTAAGGPSPSPTAGSATLTWTLSRDTDVAGYRIYRGTRSGEYGAPLAVVTGPVTSYQATGLQPNTTYYFVVTAYDHANNESVVSNEVSKSVY